MKTVAHTAFRSSETSLRQLLSTRPGGKVVANKREWESCGVKTVTGRTWTVRNYRYEDAQSFRQWNENDSSMPPGEHSKYLIPEFGFVTPLFERPKEPHGRVRRLYTTRPFFQGFDKENPETKTILGVQITKAQPGTLVILCEGRNRAGFYICRSCGAHMTRPRGKHGYTFGLRMPTRYFRAVFSRSRAGHGCSEVAVSTAFRRMGNLFSRLRRPARCGRDIGCSRYGLECHDCQRCQSRRIRHCALRRCARWCRAGSPVRAGEHIQRDAPQCAGAG